MVVLLTILFICLKILFKWKFFEVIPLNHIVCVEISGRFQHMLCHGSDKRKIKQTIDELPASFRLVNLSRPDRESNWRPEFKEIVNHFNLIKTRDEPRFPSLKYLSIPYLFVHFLNWHFKSWIPWSTLREVKVVKTQINSQFNPATMPLNDKITTNGPKKDANGNWLPVPYKIDEQGNRITTLLRIEFPRVGFSSNIELKLNVHVDLVWSASRVRIFDPFNVFFNNPDISAWLDLQVNQALVNYVGRFSLDELQAEPLTADPRNKLNDFFKDKNTGQNAVNAGLLSSGFTIPGAFSVIDFELDPAERALADAKRDEAISQTKRQIAQNEADAAATRTTTQADADAQAIRVKGAAEADVVTLTGNAKNLITKDLAGIITPDGATEVLRAEQIAKSKITTWAPGNQMILQPGQQSGGQPPPVPPTNPPTTATPPTPPTPPVNPPAPPTPPSATPPSPTPPPSNPPPTP